MFRIGQKVVCVKGHKDPFAKLVIGEIYPVLAVHECPKCGAESIDVGITHPNPLSVPEFSNCKCGYEEQTPIWWFYASRFRPIDEAFGENIAAEIEQQLNKAHVKTPPDRRTEYA